MAKANSNRHSKRGRKPILTAAQRSSVAKMVSQAFKAGVRKWGKKG